MKNTLQIYQNFAFFPSYQIKKGAYLIFIKCFTVPFKICYGFADGFLLVGGWIVQLMSHAECQDGLPLVIGERGREHLGWQGDILGRRQLSPVDRVEDYPTLAHISAKGSDEADNLRGTVDGLGHIEQAEIQTRGLTELQNGGTLRQGEQLGLAIQLVVDLGLHLGIVEIYQVKLVVLGEIRNDSVGHLFEHLSHRCLSR